jgi:DNA-binding XRE family transcriptional regulator
MWDYPATLRRMSAVNAHDRRFAARLAHIRKMRGHKQEDLAALIGVSRFVITGIETGGRGVKLGEALELCRVLNVDLHDMVSDEPMKLRIEMPVD